jgi:RNA polymerase sigma-70 factor, ECF subfamily
MEPIISEDLIRRLKAGDVSAFDEFYSATKDKIYKTVYVMAANKQEVDEMVNEIYFQIWKSISNYNVQLPFNYWVNGLVFRQVKRWRLKAWKQHNLFQMVLKNINSINKGTVMNNHEDGQDQLLSIIEKMSYKLKEVILLYYFYNYSQKEIAIILNIPVGTVKSRHHSALNYLRKFLKEPIERGDFKNVK